MRFALISVALLSAAASMPLMAQSNDVELRVNKLEREMRAVQKKVFPGAPQVQPEIGALATGDLGPAATSTTTPLTDLTSRLDALESQLRMLTGQVETDGNRLRKLEEAVRTLATTTDSRLKALEPPPPVTVVENDAAVSGPPAATPVMEVPTPAPRLAPAPRPTPAATTPTRAAPAATPASGPASGPASKNDGSRKALVDAVEVPVSGDTAEDAYSYGFRLWQAKLYPEAQAKLKEFATKYPRHRRASYAQNLLGRAYLDEGKPALASVAFYENYTRNSKGERAAESLYYLGVSLTRLKKLPDACKVYDEFADVYGMSAAAELQARVAKGRADAKCT
jgi:TolA-binding protein